MAYAALVSLMQVTQQILRPDHPNHSLQNTKQINSLHKRVCSLLAFLEDYAQNRSSTQALIEILEARIREAAFAAEDIIESRSICNHYSSNTNKNCFSQLLCALEDVICPLRKLTLKEEIPYLGEIIREIDSILEEVMRIKDGKNGSIQDFQLPRNSISESSTTSPVKTFVGFEEELMQLKNKLTGHESELQIIPIVGMGGMGKTTLARNLYEDQLIVENFDIRVWVTVSQEYSVRDILSSLVNDVGSFVNTTTQIEGKENLAECLYKRLKGRRYLIIMDDVWDTNIWDELKRLFPDDCNSSRVMLTTRISSVASYVDSSSNHHQMRFLNEDESWSLFSQHVFGHESCPEDLEEIGKRIAKNCQGLPLAILVIGGLMSKLGRTAESWENVSNTVNSIITLNDDQCSKILSLSYNYLPPHLRPCFLYMGVFPEDFDIRVSRLIKLWIAEGFLKPDIRGKSLEDIAEENLQNLVDRHLISVKKKGSNGKMKICGIHDLLRDLCIKEAHKHQFVNVLNKNFNTFSDGMNNHRGLIIHQNIIEDDCASEDHVGDTYDLMKRMPLARSFLCIGRYLNLSYFYHGFRLLRVLDMIQTEFNEFPVEVLELINLRYLALRCREVLPPSISALWNLHVLIFYKHGSSSEMLPSEIWIMPQLRHVLFNGSCFPYPLENEENSIMLENLQTVSLVVLSESLDQFLRRAPNLKKLGVYCTYEKTVLNLDHLQKLEKLKLVSHWWGLPVFPRRLKKLTLRDCSIPWEKMAVIGLLPNLEVLKIQKNCPGGWVPAEDGFPQLKFLLLKAPRLEHWGGDSTHFPRLETLVLRNCWELKEIPYDIGEIPTLQLIELHSCSPSSVISARELLEEQEGMANFDLRVRVTQ